MSDIRARRDAVLKSSISIKAIGNSVTNFTKGLFKARTTASEIAQQTNESNKFKRTLIGQDDTYFRKRRDNAPCTIEVSNTFESLHAHVRFNNGAIVNPGDEVIVHGDPVKAPYGEVISEAREATILRATPLERLWTRVFGKLEFMEICEFSFSEEVSL